MIIGRWYFQGLLLRKLINRIEQKQELQGAMRSLTEHSYQTDVRAQLSFEGAFLQFETICTVFHRLIFVCNQSFDEIAKWRS